MEPFINTAIRAARAAGDLINRYADRIDTLTITEKQHNDFVSEIDKHAEQIIIDAIHKAYPDHAIFAEESGAQGDNETVWIIDPLDGTRNYLHGFPHYSVSIAVQIKGRIEHGVIYDPVRGEIFAATRGRGARLNDKRIRVSRTSELSHAMLGTGFPFRHKELLKSYMTSFENLFDKSSGIRRAGSAALDLAYVASGRLDGFWECRLNLWDIAAGVLMIKEAGGLSCDFDGGDDHLKTGNIVAGNPKICKAVLQTLKKSQ
jgi:myo-inositol-1(or 4)-monophosphatase